jgi:hypothetical protein
MDYEAMSNEELYRLIMERFARPHFREVTNDNRQTVIAILMFFEDEGGRQKCPSKSRDAFAL